MKRTVVKDYETMSQVAAEHILSFVRRSEQSINICLPTGRTPVRMYQILADYGRMNPATFRNVNWLTLDDYIKEPSDSDATCYDMLYQQFYQPAGISLEHTFTYQTQVDRLKEEANRYERLIESLGGIDLAVLGIGRNGHVGFNEPGSTSDSETRVVNLHDKTVEQSKGYFGRDTYLPERGITLGMKTLLKSSEVLMIANGSEKREIVEKVYKGIVGPDVPASFFQTHPHASLVIDEACSY